MVDVKDKINQLVNQYLESVNLLKEFIAAPSEVTDKIINNNLLPETLLMDFKDIKRGLLGEFSKTQSVEIGRHKLIRYIESITETIKKELPSPESFTKDAIKDLTPNLNIMYTESDLPMLGRRQNSYLKNALTIQYMNTKMVPVLENKARELGLSCNNRDFLLKIENLLASVRVMDFDNLTNMFTIYNRQIELVEHNFKNVGTNGFIRDEFTAKHALINNDFNTYLKDTINAITIEDGIEITELDILNRIIGSLDRTQSTLQKNADALVEVLQQVPTIAKYEGVGSFAKIFIDIYSSILEPYLNTSITTEEFTKRVNDSVIIIKNCLGIDTDLIHVITNKFTELNNGLQTYLYVYQLVNEVTAKGLIGPEPKK